MPEYDCTVTINVTIEREVTVEAANEDAAVEAAEVEARDWVMSDVNNVEVEVDRVRELQP